MHLQLLVCVITLGLALAAYIPESVTRPAVSCTCPAASTVFTTVTAVETTATETRIFTDLHTVTLTLGTANDAILPPAPSASTPPQCISAAAATALIDRVKKMLTSPWSDEILALIEATFDDTYVETSDSYNSLVGRPMGTLKAASRAELIAQRRAATPVPEIATLDVLRDCGSVVWFFAMVGVGWSSVPVRAVSLLYLTPDGARVNMVNSEMNSLQYARNLEG